MTFEPSNFKLIKNQKPFFIHKYTPSCYSMPNLLPQFINKVPHHIEVMNDIVNIVTTNFFKV